MFKYLKLFIYHRKTSSKTHPTPPVLLKSVEWEFKSNKKMEEAFKTKIEKLLPRVRGDFSSKSIYDIIFLSVV